jgi:hypothetical protein
VYIKSIRLILKKNIFTILKVRKILIKARILLKLFIKHLAKALIKEVIILGIINTSTFNYIIRLL